MNYKDPVTITDVTLREFGQNVPAEYLHVFTPEVRADMARRLADAGFKHIEVFSCVNPRVAPAMAEPLAVSLYAVEQTQPQPDDYVVVLGLGVIGLGILEGGSVSLAMLIAVMLSLSLAAPAAGQSVTLNIPISAPRMVIAVPKDALVQAQGRGPHLGLA